MCVYRCRLRRVRRRFRCWVQGFRSFTEIAVANTANIFYLYFHLFLLDVIIKCVIWWLTLQRIAIQHPSIAIRTRTTPPTYIHSHRSAAANSDCICVWLSIFSTTSICCCSNIYHQVRVYRELPAPRTAKCSFSAKCSTTSIAMWWDSYDHATNVRAWISPLSARIYIRPIDFTSTYADSIEAALLAISMLHSIRMPLLMLRTMYINRCLNHYMLISTVTNLCEGKILYRN